MRNGEGLDEGHDYDVAIAMFLSAVGSVFRVCCMYRQHVGKVLERRPADTFSPEYTTLTQFTAPWRRGGRSYSVSSRGHGGPMAWIEKRM